MSKFFKLKKVALAINSVGFIASSIFSFSSQAAVTYYQADSSNSTLQTIGLGSSTLGSGILDNPTNLVTGLNQYAYGAVTFTATENGTYLFGQTYSPLDTVMILYDGVFDPTTPGTGALVANDDKSASAHQTALGDPSASIRCGNQVNFCPQMSQTVVAGQTYTLWVSHYYPNAITNFEYPFTFYSTGNVVFGQYTGRNPINMIRPFYSASDLGVLIDPMFVGGMLRMDQVNAIYHQDFTLSTMVTNTIDQYGNNSVFSGVLSDAVSGNAGNIIIDNSGAGGSVTFAADNTYTGSTTLKGGVLVVAKDTNLGHSSASLILDGGTLLTTESFTTDRNVTLLSGGTINVTDNNMLTLSGSVSGSGTLIKDGNGTLVMENNGSYDGVTSIAGGALIIGGSNNPNVTLSGSGDVTVAAGAQLGGYGSVTGNVVNDGSIAIGSALNTSTTRSVTLSAFTINGNLTNNNEIKLGSALAAGDVLTINGNYIGNSGSLVMYGNLHDDGSVTDKLIITGDASGTTYVTINNVGGDGAQVIDGIEIIQVGGTSADGAFIQNGRIVAGVYEYNLVKGNISGTGLESWFLSSQKIPGSKTGSNYTLRPEVGAYISLAEFNQGTFNHSFHDRQQLLDNNYQSSWARLEYTKSKSKAGEDDQLINKVDRTLLHLGSDIYQKESLHLGLMAAYSKGDIKSSSTITDLKATSKSDGYSVGVYGTWFNQDRQTGGIYLDTYAQYNWFNNKIDGQSLAAEKFNSHGMTFSAETGYGFLLGESVLVEPQLQFIYNDYTSDDRTEANGTQVRTTTSDDFISRVGVRIQGQHDSIQPFVTLNYWHYSNQAAVSMDDVEMQSSRARNLFEVKVGGQVKLTDNVKLYGQLQNSFGEKSTSNYGGNLGVGVDW